MAIEQNTSSKESPFAGFFARGFSALIDLILVMLIFLIINLPFSAEASWNYSSRYGMVTTVEFLYPLHFLLFIVTLALYWTLTEALWGAGLGKLLFQQRVVGLKGEKITFKTALLRNVFTPLDLILSAGFLLFTRKNQTLGDKIANTVVVIKKQMGQPLVNQPVSWVKKGFGGLFFTIVLLFAALTLWTVPKIMEWNDLSRTTLAEIQEKNVADRLSLYDSFSTELKEAVSFEAFEEIFDSTEFKDLFNSLAPSDIRFHYWSFNEDQAMIIGKQDDLIVRFQFVKNENEWKLLEFKLIPSMEPSLFGLIDSFL